MLSFQCSSGLQEIADIKFKFEKNAAVVANDKVAVLFDFQFSQITDEAIAAEVSCRRRLGIPEYKHNVRKDILGSAPAQFDKKQILAYLRGSYVS